MNRKLLNIWERFKTWDWDRTLPLYTFCYFTKNSLRLNNQNCKGYFKIWFYSEFINRHKWMYLGIHFILYNAITLFMIWNVVTIIVGKSEIILPWHAFWNKLYPTLESRILHRVPLIKHFSWFGGRILAPISGSPSEIVSRVESC